MIGFDVETAVRSRRSVRSYDTKDLTEDDRKLIDSWINDICNEQKPFPAKMKVRLLGAVSGTDTEKLGTYGVIRGARCFLCVTVEDLPGAMEAVGYHFEKLVLSATAHGLGTCWLAGTFRRDRFSEELSLGEKEIFPIVCPIGYPADRMNIINNIFRKASGSDHRKSWNEIFFKKDFASPLNEDEAGEYAFPLEMLRLAPSAANRQPWRVVMNEKGIHFYKKDDPKSKYPYDLQRLDVGIGMCHFHLALMEKGIAGEFAALDEIGIDAPDEMRYIVSWLKD